MAEELGDLIPRLDERNRRLVLGAWARTLGHGGISRVARIAGVHPSTVSRGIAELAVGLAAGPDDTSRVRRVGAGRKPLTVSDPGLVDSLLELLEPRGQAGRGPLAWTTMSTRGLAAELAGRGHRVSAWSVANLLRDAGFRLQSGSGSRSNAAERSRRFGRVHDQARAHLDAGQPVVAATVHRRELVGTGWRRVRPDRETAAVAAATIRDWWERGGRVRHRLAWRILIAVDGGSGRGVGEACWRIELAGFGAETGLRVTVCQLPVGTVRWNPIADWIATDLTQRRRGNPPTRHEIRLCLVGDDSPEFAPPAPRSGTTS